MDLPGSMNQGTFKTVYRSGANAGIIERSEDGRRYNATVHGAAAMPLLEIWWRFREAGSLS